MENKKYVCGRGYCEHTYMYEENFDTYDDFVMSQY